ncbi:MAG: hypothetical protein ACPHMS_07015, partial [Candidatus Poseidoniaceae archaeon]
MQLSHLIVSKGGIEEPPNARKKCRCSNEVRCAQRTRRRDESRNRSDESEVVIETGAGVAANYHDADYEAAGATVGSREDALACETIITIRFPGVEGMKEGTKLACVSDPFRNPQFVK